MIASWWILPLIGILTAFYLSVDEKWSKTFSGPSAASSPSSSSASASASTSTTSTPSSSSLEKKEVIRKNPLVSFITRQTLEQSKGDSSRLLLSLLGHCFDVSAGQTFYGTNGGYSFFTGTDATRSFATGDFEKDLNDDLADFSPSQCVAIEGWLDFYMKSEKYPFVGYLEDSKYVLPLKERNLNMDINAAGEYSELKILGGESYEAFSSCVQRGKDDIEMEKTRSGGVTCNKEMNIKLGTGTIWCSDKNTNSNINEQTNDDYHVPRRMVITQASDNSVSEKCVCVVLSQATTRSDLNVYDNCKPNARTCSITA